ncbi:MAG: hypothetical protein AAFS11_03830 [Planctomycetota bacterium]
MSENQSSLPSLMDEFGGESTEAPSKGKSHSKPPRDPKQAKRIRGALGALGGLAIGGGMVWAVLTLMPVPKPDYDTGAIDDVLGYTLLTTEFDQLPLEERIDLIGQVVKRVESMNAEEGTLMAAFAAGIAGEAREQLEENAAGVMIDIWDEFAPGYQRITDAAEREAYLEQATADMIRLFERMDGDPTEKTDDELLADAREQAERDRDRFTDPMRGPSTAGLARFATFMNREIGDRASPQQRARIARISRDMTRYLRGEDLGGN